MDDTQDLAVTVQRTGPAPIAKIGLLGATAAALVAVGILAAGVTATPAGTLAADTDTGTTLLTLDGPGRGFGGGHGFGGITITAISGPSISLETVDGWTRTITVDSGTTYTESGETIAVSDLEVGDEIRFQQTLEDDGSFSIDAVAVIPPHAGGTVTAVSGSTITVTQRDGTSATITVTSATTYEVNRTEGASLGDVEVGMVLMAEGTENSDGSLTATTVRAADPGAFRGPGGGHHGPRGFPGDGTTPDATTAPDTTSDSAG